MFLANFWHEVKTFLRRDVGCAMPIGPASASRQLFNFKRLALSERLALLFSLSSILKREKGDMLSVKYGLSSIKSAKLEMIVRDIVNIIKKKILLIFSNFCNLYPNEILSRTSS